MWWLGLLFGVLVAYFVLRNFAMNYWMFMAGLVGFAGSGAVGGRALGAWIDRNHRTKRGLLKQELKQCRIMRRWLRRTLRRHGNKLEAAIIRKRLEGIIEHLGELMTAQQPDLEQLVEERRKVEQFSEEHLTRFKKSAVREYIESIGVAVLIALALRAFVIEAFQIPSGSMIPSLRVGDHIFVNKLAYGIRVPLLPLRIGSTRIPALALNWSVPEPGDVIVFIEPENEEEDYIKRVIAVGGDTVEVHQGLVLVNAEAYQLVDAKEFKYNDLDEDGEFRGRVATRQFEEIIPGAHHPILRKSCVDHRDCRLRMGTDCDFGSGLCVQPDFGPYKVPEGHVFVMGDNRDNSRDSRVWKSVPMAFVKGRAEFIWWSYREALVQWDRMFTKIR
jgi:signal peptidase I